MKKLMQDKCRAKKTLEILWGAALNTLSVPVAIS